MVLNVFEATLISARVGAINCFENLKGIRGKAVVAGTCKGLCSEDQDDVEIRKRNEKLKKRSSSIDINITYHLVQCFLDYTVFPSCRAMFGVLSNKIVLNIAKRLGGRSNETNNN